jgi:hypothetical protein
VKKSRTETPLEHNVPLNELRIRLIQDSPGELIIHAIHLQGKLVFRFVLRMSEGDFECSSGYYRFPETKLRGGGDGTLAIFHGPRCLARYTAAGKKITSKHKRVA